MCVCVCGGGWGGGGRGGITGFPLAHPFFIDPHNFKNEGEWGGGGILNIDKEWKKSKFK